MSAILQVEDIHTYYGDAYVLQGLSLVLEQGQILGLLGRNGVGKTTLVNSIVGFNPPRRGRIVFKGTDITQMSSYETVRAGMGLVPQGRRVFPTLSVEENLRVAEGGNGRRGWTLERLTIEMIEPRYLPLIGYADGWSAATPGEIVASPVLVGGKSPEEVGAMRAQLKGAIVMTQPIRGPISSR